MPIYSGPCHAGDFCKKWLPEKCKESADKDALISGANHPCSGSCGKLVHGICTGMFKSVDEEEGTGWTCEDCGGPGCRAAQHNPASHVERRTLKPKPKPLGIDFNKVITEEDLKDLADLHLLGGKEGRTEAGKGTRMAKVNRVDGIGNGIGKDSRDEGKSNSKGTLDQAEPVGSGAGNANGRREKGEGEGSGNGSRDKGDCMDEGMDNNNYCDLEDMDEGEDNAKDKRDIKENGEGNGKEIGEGDGNGEGEGNGDGEEKGEDEDEDEDEDEGEGYGKGNGDGNGNEKDERNGGGFTQEAFIS